MIFSLPRIPLSKALCHCGKAFKAQLLLDMLEPEQRLNVVGVARSCCSILALHKRGEAISTSVLAIHTVRHGSTTA